MLFIADRATFTLSSLIDAAVNGEVNPLGVIMFSIVGAFGDEKA
jgi:hypothetical protein